MRSGLIKAMPFKLAVSGQDESLDNSQVNMWL